MLDSPALKLILGGAQVFSADELRVLTLGEADRLSPLHGEKAVVFVGDGDRVRIERRVASGDDQKTDHGFEEAGPRKQIFFDPARTTAAIVTCGGLSPGLNNVIRGIYSEITHNYGVSRVLGIRSGYLGLNPAVGPEPIELDAAFVEEIHYLGGTVLGTSRGPQDPGVVVDYLESAAIDILFCIGGDGTQRGAHAIFDEISRRDLPKSVIGIPKTIDNDIPFVSMTFGYMTALSEAERVLRGAHVEARGAVNGIAIVKLMGRDAGFIAAGAALASDEANFVLIPEIEFPLEGAGGFLEALRERMESRQHALIVVAEGAGQHLFEQDQGHKDASGNVRYEDIGVFLSERIREYFGQQGLPVSVKYIDPGYVIRSVPANAWDRVLASQMARAAVHAAMSGRTDMLIGYWNADLVHVPLPVVAGQTRRVGLQSDMWSSVLSATGQPRWGLGQS
ncbi:ATP-dependent 6-phosphofructokinase [bacterium]|nr:MAG: ATP-dependent 6-phosphofructokinase [bacterium]